MTDSVVIGLGFGDEGKGRTVDYLCQETINRGEQKPLVTRFSGGGQAGHTVVLPDGTRHVFSNLGSGTLRGCPTYWSEYCPFDPQAFMKERSILAHQPEFLLNNQAPLITPYDIAAQRANNKNRAHGTVGCGIGTTHQRQADHYNLFARDLYHETAIRLKLENISKYYGLSLDEEPFLKACGEALQHVTPVDYMPDANSYPNVIFEGSQGLLLDQEIGFFPYVTRSYTSTRNTRGLADSPTIYAVTRAYQTRHGPGPMTNRSLVENRLIKIDPAETNVWGAYQGHFRRTILDADLLQYALDSDPLMKDIHQRDVLVITCMDHMSEFMYTTRGKLIRNQTASDLKRHLYFNRVLVSYGHSGSMIDAT